MKFNSKLHIRGEFKSDWSLDELKNELMFYNCSLPFAYDNGGLITKKFIEGLPKPFCTSTAVLDSRVHMLMPGWYPCIPGWHHDDVPRSSSSGQPNYINPEYHADHVVGLVNAEICPTEFLLGDFELSDPANHKLIYREWHKELENYSLAGNGEIYQAESGKYIVFDADTFHQGVKANKSGWRWFCRVSINTNRVKSITNEIRRQAQVYLEFPMEGW